jgi:hypothetical protein
MTALSPQQLLKGVAEGLIDFLKREEILSREGDLFNLFGVSFLVQPIKGLHFCAASAGVAR